VEAVTSLRIGWAAIIVVSNITLLIGIADAQMSRIKPAPGESAQAYVTRLPPASDGWLPPNERTVERVALQPVRTPTPAHYPPLVTPAHGTGGTPTPRTMSPVAIPAHGMGGNLNEHKLLFAHYQYTGASVELRGPCYSACTILTAYVGKDKLCIGPGAFMAFHAVRAGWTGPRLDDATLDMVRMLPPEIQTWIDRNGGADKLPRDGFWTMYDRDLWAMGYPKCK
jgi:hypothetical protein